MAGWRNISLVCICFLLLARAAYAQGNTRTLILENFDTLNRKMTDSGSVWYGYGNIRLRMDSTVIVADSMIWYRDYEIIHFFGDVEVSDSVQHIQARQLSYYHRDSSLVARGDVVIVQSHDSVKTESQLARYDRASNIIYLEGTPRLFLNYPDTANMIQVDADYLTFYQDAGQAEAVDNVVITYQETRATSGCAEYYRHDDLLILRDQPHAVRDSSDISGTLMQIRFAEKGIEQIDVFEEAKALFVEESDTTGGEFSGQTKLSGDNIVFYFSGDQVRRINASGAAQSEYFPPADDTTGAGKNFVSGDSIFIYVGNRKISKVEIKGGAEGVYITKPEAPDSISGDTLAAAVADTTSVRTSEATEAPVVDSLHAVAPDSAAIADTLAAVTPEDSIHYQGRFLEYFAKDRIIRVSGDAKVRQGQVALDANQIDYDVPRRVVLATAKVDTVDTAKSVVPLMLKDGNEEIIGSKLVFNVDTKQGLIEDATTSYEQAYYRGKDLFKEEDKVFYVEDGLLTSCDLPEPHFHFSSKRMKIIHNDRVIAKPVVFYVETLPVMIIPYYIFPLKRGRHSGILPLRFGNFEKGNRYLGNIGYYWAASDYWDMQGSMDFYENIGITFNGSLRYSKRYGFTGNVYGSYARNRQEGVSGLTKSDTWRVSGNHAQKLPYDVDFRADWLFTEKSYTDNYIIDQQQRLDRSIQSKANFAKRFGRAGLSLSFSHTKNIDTDQRRSSLPRGALSLPSFHPFGSGRIVDGVEKKSWYNQFYVGYNNVFEFSGSRDKRSDGVTTGKDIVYINHRASISAPQKLFKYVTFGPSVSLQETWYYIMDTQLAREQGISVNHAYRRGAISAGVGSETNLYGTFPINLLGLLALRHVMTPTVSFSWSPTVTTNAAVKSYTGIGGGGGRSMSMGFGLTHLIQAKVKSGDTDKKLDLLRVTSNTSYNFVATGQKFGFLNTSISSSLARNLSVQGSLTHTFYDENDKLHFWSPSLRSFSISSSFQARGSVADDYVRQGLESQSTLDSLQNENTTGLGVNVNTDTNYGAGSGSWNVNLSHYYSENKDYGSITSRIHWIRATFNVDLTENWKIKYSQTYDFVRHQSIDKMVDLYRRLHCWEGHFYWIPTGSRQGYYFKINVISIPDIKIEKSESGLRGALFNR